MEVVLKYLGSALLSGFIAAAASAVIGEIFTRIYTAQLDENPPEFGGYDYLFYWLAVIAISFVATFIFSMYYMVRNKRGA